MDFEALLWHHAMPLIIKHLDLSSYGSLLATCSLLHQQQELFPYNPRLANRRQAYRVLEREIKKGKGFSARLLKIKQHLTRLNCIVKIVWIRQVPLSHSTLFTSMMMRRSPTSHEALQGQELEVTFLLFPAGREKQSAEDITVNIHLQGKEKKVAIVLTQYQPLILEVLPSNTDKAGKIGYGINITDLEIMLPSYLYTIEVYRSDPNVRIKSMNAVYKVLTRLAP